MRRRFGDLATLWRAVWLASVLGAGVAAAQPQMPVVTIATAQALLEPQGLAPIERRADLVRRWDVEFPGRDGRAVYHIDLPPHAGDEPTAVLFSRVGNQVQVRLNGAAVQSLGENEPSRG